MTIVSMVVLVLVLVVGETIQTTPQDSKLQYPSILRFCLDIVQAVLEVWSGHEIEDLNV